MHMGVPLCVNTHMCARGCTRVCVDLPVCMHVYRCMHSVHACLLKTAAEARVLAHQSASRCTCTCTHASVWTCAHPWVGLCVFLCMHSLHRGQGLGEVRGLGLDLGLDFPTGG